MVMVLTELALAWFEKLSPRYLVGWFLKPLRVGLLE